MTQQHADVRPARYRSRGSRSARSACATADLAGTYPAEVVSCGVPFLFVPLATRAAVDAVSIDRALRIARCLHAARASTTSRVHLHHGRAGSAGDETVYSRMLAPGFGVAEDPATGGASGPLGCYLFSTRLLPRERLTHMVSLQGVKMRRPSRIHISIDANGDEITRVRVGGRSVLVGHGELTL